MFTAQRQGFAEAIRGVLEIVRCNPAGCPYPLHGGQVSLGALQGSGHSGHVGERGGDEPRRLLVLAEADGVVTIPFPGEVADQPFLVFGPAGVLVNDVDVVRPGGGGGVPVNDVLECAHGAYVYGTGPDTARH